MGGGGTSVHCVKRIDYLPYFCNIAKAYSRLEKGCRKKSALTVPKDNFGYDEYTVPDTVAVEPTFLPSFSVRKHPYMASRAFFQICLKCFT